MKKLIVKHRPWNPDYWAGSKDGTRWGCGKSSDEAIGSAIAAHPEFYGIDLVREDIEEWKKQRATGASEVEGA